MFKRRRSMSINILNRCGRDGYHRTFPWGTVFPSFVAKDWSKIMLTAGTADCRSSPKIFSENRNNTPFSGQADQQMENCRAVGFLRSKSPTWFWSPVETTFGSSLSESKTSVVP